MPNNYTQLYVHFVFAVKYRQALIEASWEERLHKYITGIVQNNQHKLLAINSVADHSHLFVGLHPAQSIAELLRLVKGDSAEFVNRQGMTKRKLQWQDGYGAFSHSQSQVSAVAGYIAKQKEHHRKTTFHNEYIGMLNDFGIVYDERYVFHAPFDE